MIRINKLYINEDEARQFVAECEKNFEEHLSNVCRGIAQDSLLRCVTLAGPTCSGKTTTAAKLTSTLEAMGRRARVLSIDDFYYESDEMSRRGIVNFEGPDAIDLEYFRNAVEALSKKEKILLPTFDFSTRKRAAYTEYKPSSGDIYIFEGIQAIYPEITDILGHFGFRSIFISVADDAEVCKTVFERNEIRLMRRIVRDYYHRGAVPEYTMSLWNSVRLNEEVNIFPNVSKNAIKINSMLPYEIFLIGKYFLEVTAKYPADGVHAMDIMGLRQRLSALSATSVDISMIPMNSVFREFIV